MARKSRKNSEVMSRSVKDVCNKSTNGEEKISTALYARLSNENNGRDDDESLQNQISQLRAYLSEHSSEYELYDTYIDNGHSGTNFDRPDFIRMMDDVNHGKIGCIIVKDLSRFARNSIETGVYIEHILPKLNVKLIAINDNFDSSREADRQSITVPVKNMVNEMYSKDLSRKMFLANVIRSNRENTLLTGPSPYGYKKNETKTQYIPDENSDYVRMIFQWTMLGATLFEIADRLNIIGAPVARNLIAARAGDYKWTQSAVTKIIANPVYSGCICFGRRKRTKVGTQRESLEVPREQWVIHENRHEALVPRADFDFIYDRKKQNQIIKEKQMEEAKRKMIDINCDFSNLVFCAECHKKMVTKMDRNEIGDKVTHIKYVCTGRRKTDISCFNVVYNDLLRVVVMDQVKIHLKLLINQAEMIKRIKESGNGKDYNLSIDKQITSATVRLDEKRELEAKIYEDYKAGIIDEDDFKHLHEKSVASRQKAENDVNGLLAKKDAYVRLLNHFLTIVDNYEYCPEEDGFDARLVQIMVERINVYHDNRFEVVFKYQGWEKLISEVLENN